MYGTKYIHKAVRALVTMPLAQGIKSLILIFSWGSKPGAWEDGKFASEVR